MPYPLNPKPAGTWVGIWTAEREAAFRELHAAGGKDREIAAALGLPWFVVRDFRRLLGLPGNHAYPWTPEQDAAIRDEYTRRGGAGRLAARFGVTVHRVALRAKSLGLQRPNPNIGAGRRREWDADALRAAHAEGLTDAQVGRRLGVSGCTAKRRRESLGLPENARTRREQLSEWMKTVHRLGLSSHAAHRRRLREMTAPYHLPADLRLMQVRILFALLDGPATRRQLTETLGLTMGGDGYAESLNSRGRNRRTGLMTDLIARGLVAEYHPPGAPSQGGSGQRVLFLTAAALACFAGTPTETAHGC